MEYNNNRNRWQQRAERNTKSIRTKVCTPLRYRSESNVTSTPYATANDCQPIRGSAYHGSGVQHGTLLRPPRIH